MYSGSSDGEGHDGSSVASRKIPTTFFDLTHPSTSKSYILPLTFIRCCSSSSPTSAAAVATTTSDRDTIRTIRLKKVINSELWHACAGPLVSLPPVGSLVVYFPQGHSEQPGEFFCKTLTASDTSTHGGFSVPRRAVEKIFPPLDFSMQPRTQELIARDLHDQSWTFRHIYRDQPKRHLLTTGWSIFVSSKRVFAGDSKKI